MQLVIQFQNFFYKINMLTNKNQKMNKRNKGITEVKIAPLIQFIIWTRNARSFHCMRP